MMQKYKRKWCLYIHLTTFICYQLQLIGLCKRWVIGETADQSIGETFYSVSTYRKSDADARSSKKRKSETRSGSNITGNSHEQGGAGRGRGGDGGDGDLRVFKWETDARSDVRLLFKQMIICFSHTISEVNNHGEQCPKMQQLIQQGRIVLRKKGGRSLVLR